MLRLNNNCIALFVSVFPGGSYAHFYRSRHECG